MKLEYVSQCFRRLVGVRKLCSIEISPCFLEWPSHVVIETLESHSNAQESSPFFILDSLQMAVQKLSSRQSASVCSGICHLCFLPGSQAYPSDESLPNLEIEPLTGQKGVYPCRSSNSVFRAGLGAVESKEKIRYTTNLFTSNSHV